MNSSKLMSSVRSSSTTIYTFTSVGLYVSFRLLLTGSALNPGYRSWSRTYSGRCTGTPPSRLGSPDCAFSSARRSLSASFSGRAVERSFRMSAVRSRFVQITRSMMRCASLSRPLAISISSWICGWRDSVVSYLPFLAPKWWAWRSSHADCEELPW